MCAMVFDKRSDEQQIEGERQWEGVRDGEQAVMRARGVHPAASVYPAVDEPSQQIDHPEMTPQLSEMIRGKSIVAISNGQVIGNVVDVMILPETLEVAALITNKGNLFNRETDYIPAEAVQVWGENVILVQDPNVVMKKEANGDQENWLSVIDKIRGRYVISLDGKRIGQLNDVTINNEGRIVEYSLGQVYIDGPLSKSKRIPVRATHTLGKDVMIVDMSKVNY